MTTNAEPKSILMFKEGDEAYIIQPSRSKVFVAEKVKVKKIINLNNCAEIPDPYLDIAYEIETDKGTEIARVGCLFKEDNVNQIILSCLTEREKEIKDMLPKIERRRDELLGIDHEKKLEDYTN